jgi:hypothetical protein
MAETGGQTQCHWKGVGEMWWEVIPEECLHELGRGFNWNGLGVFRSEGVWCKCVVAGCEHTLGQVVVVGMSGDAKVPQHGVGFPATEELDDIAVDTSAEQGCGPTRAKAARGEEGGVIACLGLELRGCDAEGCSDVSWVGEAGTGRVPVVVGVDGSVNGCRVVSEMVT